MARSILLALAGNPNVGKSTIFNTLTGSRQHVGNWPGKTVEKKSGHLNIYGVDAELVDLPGTYSLSAFSPEEKIARDFIIYEKPDVIINVVDASNLERNLYLTLQILETGVPTLLVLNMADMADKRGCQIDCHALSDSLGGIQVIPTNASCSNGLSELSEAILQLSNSKSFRCPQYSNPRTSGKYKHKGHHHRHHGHH
jgi:ferrous iron transport protein B